MKKKLVLLGVLVMSLLLIGIGKVNALSNVDISSIKYNFIQDATGYHKHGEMSIEGINFSSTYDYCITFTSNNSKPEILNDTISMDVWSCSNDKLFELNNLMENIYESKSDIYLWVASSNDNNTWDISNSKKIDRLDYFNLGERIVANYIESDGINSISFRDEVYTKNSVNYKIGVISNNEIINNINNSSVNLSDVLNYAKNDNEGKTGTTNFSTTTEIYNTINSYESDKYYYVYFFFDDYDLEDVNYYTYDAKTKMLTASKIIHYSGTANDASNSNDILNPSTSDINIILVLMTSILLIFIILFLCKKMKNIRN